MAKTEGPLRAVFKRAGEFFLDALWREREESNFQFWTELSAGTEVCRDKKLLQKFVFCNTRIVMESWALDKAILPLGCVVSHLKTASCSACVLFVRERLDREIHSKKTRIPGVVPSDKLT